MKKVSIIVGTFLVNLTKVLLGVLAGVVILLWPIPALIHFLDIPMNCFGDFFFLGSSLMMYWICLAVLGVIIDKAVKMTKKDLGCSTE